jgi:hypothetical protein
MAILPLTDPCLNEHIRTVLSVSTNVSWPVAGEQLATMESRGYRDYNTYRFGYTFGGTETRTRPKC